MTHAHGCIHRKQQYVVCLTRAGELAVQEQLLVKYSGGLGCAAQFNQKNTSYFGIKICMPFLLVIADLTHPL